ncbi:MAG: LysR family transcriptional regulator [Burkholderiales bacterium]|nr:LysR family transcriptional regulator [Burkholderiales bacterium]
MTLEQLRILVKVIQTGSFTRAAELLGTQKSYVSRVIAQLEAELEAKLLERTTRAISVTEIGREVFERAVGILGAVEDTTRLVHSARDEPRGQLRLTCGVEFGMLAVGRWIDEYLERHPLVSVDVEYTSRVLDLVHEGFDVAIRVGRVQESRLVARPLGQLDYALFACPHYLARRGRPKTPDDLAEHSLVMFSGGAHRRGWTLIPGGVERDAVKVEGPARLRVNNSFAVRDALLHSLGIGQLPLLIAMESLVAGRLVPVLPDWRPPSVLVHAVYPSSRYLSSKVRAFIDLAVSRFPGENELARMETERICSLPAKRHGKR